MVLNELLRQTEEEIKEYQKRKPCCYPKFLIRRRILLKSIIGKFDLLLIPQEARKAQ